MKHELQFNDGGADWCIHCGTFNCYLNVSDECRAAKPAKFNVVSDSGNFLRVFCDTFGDEGLTAEGQSELAKQREAMAA